MLKDITKALQTQAREQMVEYTAKEMRRIRRTGYIGNLDLLPCVDTIVADTANATLEYVKGVAEEFLAEEERVQQWISKGGVDYIDNKARIDILEKFIARLISNPE